MFNTVALWEQSRIPTFEWEGKEIRSTNRATYQLLLDYREDISFSDYHLACHNITAQLQKTKRDKGIEVSSTQRYFTILESLTFAQPTVMRDLADLAATAHMTILEQATTIPDAHIKTLKSLSEQYKIGLVSNFDDTKTAKKILNEHQIESFFQSVVISEEFGYRKPSPSIFKAALSNLATYPKEALFVGDSWDEDVIGATSSGIDAIWVNPTKLTTPVEYLSSVSSIKSITELPKFL